MIRDLPTTFPEVEDQGPISDIEKRGRSRPSRPLPILRRGWRKKSPNASRILDRSDAKGNLDMYTRRIRVADGLRPALICYRASDHQVPGWIRMLRPRS